MGNKEKKEKGFLKRFKRVFSIFKTLAILFIVLFEIGVIIIAVSIFFLSIYLKNFQYSKGEIRFSTSGNDKVLLKCNYFRFHCDYIKYKVKDKKYKLDLVVNNFDGKIQRFDINNPEFFFSTDDIKVKYIQKVKDESKEKFEYPNFLKRIPEFVGYINFDIRKIDILFKSIPDNLNLNVNLKNVRLNKRNINLSLNLDYNSEIFLKNRLIKGKFEGNKLVLYPSSFYFKGKINKFKIPEFVIKNGKSYFDFSDNSLNLPIGTGLKSEKIKLETGYIYLNNLKLNILVSGKGTNILINSGLSLDSLKFLQKDKEIVSISNATQKITFFYDFSDFTIKNNKGTVKEIYIPSGNLYINDVRLKLKNGKIGNVLRPVYIKIGKISLNKIPINFQGIKEDSLEIKNLKVITDINTDKNLIDGTAYLKRKKIRYRFDLNKNLLNVDIPKISMTEASGYFVNLSKKYNKLKDYLSLAVSGKLNLDLNKNSLNSYLKLYDINLYGLSYPSGNIDLKLSFKDKFSLNSLKLNLFNLKNKNFVNLNGSFKNNILNFNFKVNNLDISGIRPLKDKNIKSLLDINGVLEGTVDNLNSDIVLNLKKFSYGDIDIPPTKLDLKLNINKNLITVETSHKGLNLISKYDTDKNIINIDLKAENFNPNEYIQFYKDRLPEAVYKDLKISSINGSVKGDFSINKNIFNGVINFKNLNISIPKFDENFTVSIKGKIKNNEPDLVFSLKRKNIKPSKILKKLYLKGRFKNQKLSANYQMVGEGDLKDLTSKGLVNLDLDKNLIDYKLTASMKRGNLATDVSIIGDGSLDKTVGKIYSKLSVDKSVSKNEINYSIERKENGILAELGFDKLNFKYDVYSVDLKKLKGNFFIKNNDFKDISGFILSEGGDIKKSEKSLLGLGSFKLNFIKGKVSSTEPIKITNIIEGQISLFEYDLKSNNLKLQSFGILNRELVSDFITFGGLEGDLRISLGFNGNIKDYKNNLKFTLFSNNLKLKSSYFRRPLKFENLNIRYIKNKLDINIKARILSHLYGDGYLSLYGTVDLDREKHTIKLKINKLPVRYKSIFVGDISTKNFYIHIEKDNNKNNKIGYNFYVDGEIYYSGRVRVNREFQKLVMSKTEENGKAPNEKIEELKKHIFLNLKIATDNPLTIKGIFGRAVALSSVKIKNTVYKPIVDGYFKVLGGKINFMKVKYIINKLEVNIVKNKAYINAQLSTYLYDTKIYINIFGNIKSPNMTFVSQPPKSKKEIMSMLFLKDLPSAISGLTGNILPFIKDLGTFLSKLIPSEEEEGEGIFNTGIEVSIKPEYSPTEGLVPFIYAKRNISMRVYLAISRALINTETFKDSGWYEIGAKISSDVLFRYRIFENSQEEYGLTLSTYFDF